MSFSLFTLLQIAIGQRSSMGETLTFGMWTQLFRQAQQQALLGVTYSAIECLPKEERPPFSVLAQWFALTRKLEQMNTHLNTLCKKLEEEFDKEGFATCILKGQGIAQLYPQPLRRQCGDIDAWIVPKVSFTYQKKLKEPLSFRRKKIVNHVQRFFPNEKPVYHHIDFNRYKEVSVEVHFTPSWMNHPCDNTRLQRWFDQQAQYIFDFSLRESISTESRTHECYTVPTRAFNMVYVLLHIYRHIFNEGVGLRQVMDYYFVLQDFMAHATEKDHETLLRDWKTLHLSSFAQAVLWVIEKVFALPRTSMPCEPDEEKGAFLLQEILQAGNFGQYDPRIEHDYNDGSWKALLVRTQRNFRFIKHYPREVICSPFFKIWHQIWLRMKGWK